MRRQGGLYAMATQEQGKETAAQQQPEKAKKAPSQVRSVVGLVLVIGLAAVAYLEYTANRGFNAAVVQLEKALDKEDAGLLSDRDVETMVGRSADGPGVKEASGVKMSYTWQGVFRKHRLTAYYNNELPPHLLRISTE